VLFPICRCPKFASGRSVKTPPNKVARLYQRRDVRRRTSPTASYGFEY